MPLTVMLVLWACAAPAGSGQEALRPPVAEIATTGPSSTNAPEDPTQAELQQTLERLATLLNAPQDPDAKAVAALVDPAAPALRQILADYITTTRQTAELSTEPFAFQILAVAWRGAGIVEVNLRREWDERLHTWLFRQDGTQWVVTQPTSQERGPAQTTTLGPLTITFSAWDVQLAETLTPLLQQRLEHVQEVLTPPQPDGPITVVLRPTITASDAAIKGMYQPGVNPERDEIVLYTSGYAFGSYNPAKTYAESIADTFAHEYTHRVTDRSIMPLDSLPSWMAEGIAEHVAENDHLDVPQFRTLALNNVLLSTRELVQPGPDISRGLLYACAQSATTYLIEHEQIETFWHLAQAYEDAAGDSATRMEQALQQTLGLSSDQFDRQWQSWLIERARNLEARAR